MDLALLVIVVVHRKAPTAFQVCYFNIRMYSGKSLLAIVKGSVVMLAMKN